MLLYYIGRVVSLPRMPSSAPGWHISFFEATLGIPTEKPSWIPLLQGRVTNPKCRSLGGGVWKMFNGNDFFKPEVPIFCGNFSNFSSSESGIFNSNVVPVPGTCLLWWHLRPCGQVRRVRLAYIDRAAKSHASRGSGISVFRKPYLRC